ncbi:MAG: MMPL family transporter [Deltaproteobacteria bacterium]|nr:MMPL family transporter [Deltaproteobacteria bacterium]
MSSATRKLAETITARPWLTVGVALLVGAAASAVASGLKFDASFTALLPEATPEVQDLNLVKAKAGGTAELFIALAGKKPARLAYARELVQELRTKPYIRWADVEFPVDFFLDRRMLLLSSKGLTTLRDSIDEEIERAKVRANPLYVDLEEEKDKKGEPKPWAEVEAQDTPKDKKGLLRRTFESKDGRYLFVRVKPKVASSDFDKAGEIFTQVKAIVAAHRPETRGVKVEYAGSLVVNQEQHQTMLGDLSRAGVIALVLVVLLVTLHIRRVAALPVLVVPLVVGIAISMALTKLFVGQLNLVSGFLISALTGLGIEYEIHLYLRYLEKLDGLGDGLQAMRRAYLETLRGSITSACANAFCFFCLMASNFRGFREFGLIAGIGIFATFITTYLVLPPLALLFTRKPKGDHKAVRGDAVRPFRRGVAWVMVAVGAVLLAYSVRVAPQVRFHNNFKQLRGYSPAVEFQEYVEQSLGGSLAPSLVMAKDVAEARRVEAFVEQWRKQPGSGVLRVFSLASMVPKDVPEKAPLLTEIARSLRSVLKEKLTPEDRKKVKDALKLAEMKPWGVEEIPDVFKRHFLAVDGSGTFVLVWPRYEMYEDAEIMAWGEELGRMKAAMERAGIKTPILDENRVASRVLSTMHADIPYILVYAAAAVMLLLLVDFRNLRQALFVGGSLALGVVWMLGLMKLWHLEFNVFNQAVVPTLFGMGVDNAVHLQHRYDLEGPGSLGKVIATTGAAGFLASATNGIGFGATLTAHHAGIESMGMLAVLGFSCTFISTTVFLPALLRIRERKGI